jgi:hypothetical protein
MSISGNWNITIKSPMGAMPIALVFEQNNNVFTGTLASQGQTTPITEGKINGDALSWINSVTSPMKMTLEFSGAVSGDNINGNVKVGFMGKFPFEGVRAE